MKDLNLVMGSLGGCIRGICSNCEYYDSDNESACTERLMQDALEWLKLYYELEEEYGKLLERNREAEFMLEYNRRKVLDYERKVEFARKERDEARREVMKLEAELCGLKWGV